MSEHLHDLVNERTQIAHSGLAVSYMAKGFPLSHITDGQSWVSNRSGEWDGGRVVEFRHAHHQAGQCHPGSGLDFSLVNHPGLWGRCFSSGVLTGGFQWVNGGGGPVFDLRFDGETPESS